MLPIRIQRKRTKGWKMPENTINCTRPGKYGNPFVVGMVIPDEYTYKLDKDDHYHFMRFECGYVDCVENSIYLFKKYVLPTLYLEPLRGKNLACWCKEGTPCHADVLLTNANK